MNIGIPKERFVDERRVALCPEGVYALCQQGTNVYIEHDAGANAGWHDQEYEESGATIAFSPEEVFGRSDLVVKVLSPTVEESMMMREDQILISYLQLPLARRELFDQLIDRRITAIGLENIQTPEGERPVRRVMSEIAGQLSVHIAAHYLSAETQGRGILMGGVPGVPPASVGIIGAGVVGKSAAAMALDMGAHVILVDESEEPLRKAILHYGRRLQTAVINERNLVKLCRFVDVLIGAVLIEDYPTPHLVTREMVRMMKPHSVIVDVAIDQGGTVETSRPTSLSDPVFMDEGVLHYAVPNIPARVPRTSTRAFQNAVLPMICEIIRHGVLQALMRNALLRSGLNLYEGTVTRERIALGFDTDWKSIEEVLR